MKLSQLRNLIAVAEAGSLRQAAAALNLSQSSITKSIQQLEQSLGVELLIRTPQGIIPTAAGNALLNRAKVVEAELRQARNDVEMAQGAAVGEIKIMASPTVSVGLLPRAIVNFRRARPRVSFHIEEGVYPDVLPTLRTGEVDIALCLVPEMPSDEELEFSIVLQDNLTPAVRSEHPLTLGGRKALADLIGYDWIIYRRNRTGRDIVEHTFTDNGLEPPPNVVECTSFACTLALVESGDFITLLPTQIFAGRQRRSSITPLFMASPMPSWNVAAITRGRHRLSPVCQAFLDEIMRTAEKTKSQSPRL
ncbi:MAG: LysR family transcriptional regulator [Rhodospirillales bacterium]|nr:LysR family transcriptional regulator [Rhodospirillales bacterium]